mgnify:CR=1 FL=1
MKRNYEDEFEDEAESVASEVSSEDGDDDVDPLAQGLPMPDGPMPTGLDAKSSVEEAGDREGELQAYLEELNVARLPAWSGGVRGED